MIYVKLSEKKHCEESCTNLQSNLIGCVQVPNLHKAGVGTVAQAFYLE